MPMHSKNIKVQIRLGSAANLGNQINGINTIASEINITAIGATGVTN